MIKLQKFSRLTLPEPQVSGNQTVGYDFKGRQAPPFPNTGNAGALPLNANVGGNVSQVNGVYGNALNVKNGFGCTTGNTDVGSTPTQNFSAYCWVYPRSFASLFGYYMVKNYRNDGTFNSPFQTYSLQLSDTVDGDWYATITTKQNVAPPGTNWSVGPITGANRLQLNKWQHIGLTYDAAGLLLTAYLNGVAVGTRVTVDSGGGGDVDWNVPGGPRQIGGNLLEQVSDCMIADPREEQVTLSAPSMLAIFNDGAPLITYLGSP